MAIMEESEDIEVLFKYAAVDKVREKSNLTRKLCNPEKKLKDKEKEVAALTKALSKEKKANSKLEKAHQDLIKCQKDHKNKLEAKSSGNAIVSNKIGDEDNLKIEKVDALQARLSENEEYLKDLRNDLIIGLKDRSYGCRIGIKWMGELDIEPFFRVMKTKYNAVEAEDRAVEEHSLWDTYIRDPKWFPIKIIAVNGLNEEVIDPEDERLKALKAKLGDDVYKAVTTALIQLNVCEPNKKTVVPELWNYHEGRKATEKEAVSYILSTYKLKNRKLSNEIN